MISTKIIDNTLVAYSNDFKETVIDVVTSYDSTTTKSLLLDLKRNRELAGFTIVEQVLLAIGEFEPKQW